MAGHTLRNVEIFKAGKWNNDEYTTDDLDEMIRAFDRVGFQPPVKIGHQSNPGDQRAFGWVTRIFRQGRKLLADLSDVPAELYRAIKDGAYRFVSSEIIWQLERGGQKFPRVLKAVALLGADIPAVAGLKPITENLSVPDDHYETFSLPFRVREDNDDDDEEETEMSEHPSDALHRMVLNYQAEHPSLGFSKCLSLVAQTDKGCELMHAYNMEKRGGDVRQYKAFERCGTCSSPTACSRQHKCMTEVRRKITTGKYADPSAELHTRAKALQAEDRKKYASYSAAVHAAMRADPELAAEYAAWSTHHPH